MKVLGEARDAVELLEELRKRDWDIVVLDITMPGRSGLDVLKDLRSAYPELPVLILSMHPEDQYAVRVFKSGAAGYITKESAPDELVGAIRTITSGRKYVSPSLAEELAVRLETDSGQPLHEMLSDREFQVMCMLASGKTVKEVSEQLSLSVKTVSTYRTRILQKMRMKSNAELTYYAIKNRLIE
jgi:DNA-binding NarL/FixJ family response regulator